MNLAALRSDVADALDALLPTVKASGHYRQISRPGEAVVRFDSAARDLTGFGWIITAQVLIALPQDLKAAEAWIDDNVDAVIDALAGVIVVAQVAPVTLALDTGTVPALQITGTRAE